MCFSDTGTRIKTLGKASGLADQEEENMDGEKDKDDEEEEVATAVVVVVAAPALAFATASITSFDFLIYSLTNLLIWKSTFCCLHSFVHPLLSSVFP